MGQRGFLWIINATSTSLQVVQTSCHGMNSWGFHDLQRQSQERFCIEYGQGDVIEGAAGDSGEVTFQLQGTNDCFKLLCCWPLNDTECALKVDWSGITASNYQVFPPAVDGEGFGKLGWIHEGTLSLLIMETGVLNSVSPYLPGKDSIVPSQSTIKYPLTSFCGSWMEYYSDVLGKLTLNEMTLPGTHDSGTFKPLSPLGSPWIKTQSLSLAQQMKYGIRVLDLRIGQKSPGDYIICHDKFSTSYSLEEALKEVKDFINSSSKEVIILDFHRFVNLDNRGSYDYDQLKQQISFNLSGYCLPPSSVGDTLTSIWSSPAGSQRGRVVVAWNADNPDHSYMWPGVNQRWYADANSLSKLYQSIKSDMMDPPSDMWAACSFKKSSIIATPESNAKDFNPTITNWYFGGSVFCEKANIISVDFFYQYSNVIQASIISSLLKAGKK